MSINNFSTPAREGIVHYDFSQVGLFFTMSITFDSVYSKLKANISYYLLNFTNSLTAILKQLKIAN